MRDQVSETSQIPELKEENRRLRNANSFLGAQHDKISQQNSLLKANNEAL